MVSPSRKSEIKREIEALEKKLNSSIPIPSSGIPWSGIQKLNIYTDIESKIKSLKKEMYGGSKNTKKTKKDSDSVSDNEESFYNILVKFFSNKKNCVKKSVKKPVKKSVKKSVKK